MGEIGVVSGRIAGLLVVLAVILYVRGILKGTTKPNRASQFIWLVENWILLLSYRAIPETEQTVWVLWVYALGSLVIFPLSMKFGIGGLNRLDLLCLCGSGTSFLVWKLFFNQPLMPLLVNIGIDFFGFPSTCKKTAEKPELEDKGAWTVAFASCCCNLIAVKEFSFGVLSFPIYVFVLNAIMMHLLWRPRPQQIVARESVD